MDILQLLAAVHDEVWKRANAEITWGCERTGRGDNPNAGDWLFTYKCAAQPFRFWNQHDTGAPAHPALHGRSAGCASISGETGAYVGDIGHTAGILEVRVPFGRDPYLAEGREFTIVVDERLVATVGTKDAMVKLLLAALDELHEYAGVVGGFPPAKPSN